MATFRQLWGSRLRAARLATGMTQVALAETLGINSSLLSRWEAGISAPRDNMRQPLADALGVDVDVLFRFANGDDQPDPEPATVA